MTETTVRRPTIRVADATLAATGGPAQLVLANMPRMAEIANAVAAARGISSVQDDRTVVTAVPVTLIDAAGRVGGAALADLMRGLVEPAVAAWLQTPPDVWTPAGVLPTEQRPVVAAILNVTPDSFSDGGVRFGADDHPQRAVRAGRVMVEEGADLVDVGGESTRPGAQPVGVAEELRRVVPVIEALAADGIAVSVDTVKASVARAAVEAGACLVNDVSAGTMDPDMLPTIADLGVPCVLTHMQGEPRTMQDEPTYGDVVGDVFDALEERIAAAVEAGVVRERIVIDPGIGFGKRLEHNLALLRRLRELTSLGRPIMVGTSRKSFLGQLTSGAGADDRLEGSLATAVLAVANGARLVRAHDIKQTVRALTVTHAVTTA